MSNSSRLRVAAPGLAALALLAVVIPARGFVQRIASAPDQSTIGSEVTGGTLGAPTEYPTGGDVWGSTWADDGNLYSVVDDASGWQSGCNSNLLIAKETGDDPTGLTGQNVNCMADYGTAGAPTTGGGGGGAEADFIQNWKGISTISVDGVLYAAVARMRYSQNWHRQFVFNSTIIKSTDHGQTWIPSEAQNLVSPMFPDQGFAPYFIQYGQDGQGGMDGGNQYVYAISNDGFYQSGSYDILGRVARDKIGSLRGADWQFYRGGPGDEDSSWGTIDQAKPILWNSHRISTTGVLYDAPLHQYLMMQWYWGFDYSGKFAGDENAGLGTCFCTSVWTAYVASKPWGPWRQFWTHEFGPATTQPLGPSDTPGWYGAEFAPKFVSADGRHVVVFAASLAGGNPHYGLTVFPFTLQGASKIGESTILRNYS